MMMEASDPDVDNNTSGGSASGGGGSASGDEDDGDENDSVDEGDDIISALIDIYMTGLSHIVS